jgi:hypothetical protein
VLVAALLVSVLFVPLLAVHPTGAATNSGAVVAQPVQEVRSLDTTELGLSRPTGVAYEPNVDSLVVAAQRGGETALIRVTPAEDLLGSATLPATEPSTLTFDARTNGLKAISGQDVLTVSADQLSAPVPQAGRAALGAAGVNTPTGAVVDATGGMVVLDAATRTLVRIQDGDPARGVSRIPLGITGSSPLRGLAFNPADGLLYVGSPSERLLYGVDGSGALQKAYDLSSLPVADAQGFVFAPSADTTDDPATQDLYVADGGGSDSLGGVMEASLTAPQVSAASVVTATLVQKVATSAWSPASPDPSGIVYVPGLDRFQVVDSEVDETTGAGYHNVNMWQITRAGTVTDTGTTWLPAPAFSKEPTGLGFDAASNALFISDDSAHRIWIDKPGPDLRFGTADDVVTSIDMLQYGSNDTEDPEFDPSTGHLFFIDGVNVEVYELDPVDGTFGNGNDVLVNHFDMSQYGPTDLEGLGSDPAHNTLLVGGRVTKQIYEVTKSGALVQQIDASQISGMRYISGLAQGPASDNSGRRDYWTVDRNIDNGAQPTENDGQLFELTVPGTGNTAPVVNAGQDQTISAPTTSVNVSGTVSDDGLPNPPGTTTHTWSQVNGPATVTFADPNALATTVSGLTTVGDYTLRLTASDSALSTADDLVIHVVAASDPPPAAPTALGTVVTSISIDLDWANNAEADLAGYNVYRAAQSGGPYTKLNSALLTASQYSDRSAPRGTSYYRVTAVDLGGHESTPAETSAVRTILFRSVASHAAKDASSLTISKPAGAASGDLMVAAVNVRGTPTITAPSGWTLVRLDVNSSTMRQAIYTKIAATSEPSSYTWSFSAKGSTTGIIAAYQGVDPTTPVDAASGQATAASTSITAPAVTTTVPGTLLVGFFGTAANPATTPPFGMIEQAELVQNAGKNKSSLETADAFLPATGSSGTRVATASTASTNVGQLVAIRPSP